MRLKPFGRDIRLDLRKRGGVATPSFVYNLVSLFSFIFNYSVSVITVPNKRIYKNYFFVPFTKFIFLVFVPHCTCQFLPMALSNKIN